MPTTWNPAPGDEVVTWNGYDESEPSRPMTIDRLTATQIVTSDGRRFRRDTLLPAGRDRGVRRSALYSATDPCLTEAAARRAAMAERTRIARALENAVAGWVGYPLNDGRVGALRDAIFEVAPHIGLTVDIDASAFASPDGDPLTTTERICQAIRPARGDKPCTDPPDFDIITRDRAGKVLTRMPCCFAHGLAEVDRADRAGGMARTEMESTRPPGHP